jgi:hypothetical protein
MNELKLILTEVREMLKVVSEQQDSIIRNLDELKMQNKKLREEVRVNNFVLNNITPRKEILN